jgi:sugar/nucleoside kinase (ribokinase family)
MTERSREGTGGMTGTSVELDVLFAGALCFDVVLSGIDALPAPGTEVWAHSRTVSPGGVANRAVAAARLGLRTGLAAVSGDDVYADFLQAEMSTVDNLDLRWWQRDRAAATVLTTIFSDRHDRRMVSHGEGTREQPARLAQPLPCTAIAHLSADEPFPDWAVGLRATGTRLWGGVAWDGNPKGWADTLHNLRNFDVVVPNTAEALALTGASEVTDALRLLSERVPLVVVTRGQSGAVALDRRTGTVIEVPGIDIEPVDPTGAGDTFVAGLAYATLRGVPLRERLLFANLCAALSVHTPGGAVSAPGWADLLDWLATAGTTDYAFLPAMAP